ncbi:MAG TPA: hypothetical protein V6C58_03750, partial [Allocoleopsis sp.]
YIGNMFTNVVNILNQSVGRKLNTLEIMLILEEAAKNTVSGNIRRVAGMKQGNPDDMNFTTAKDNLWVQNDEGNWSIDPVRDALRMSNHTTVYHNIPTLETIKDSIVKQYYSGEGAIQYAPEAIARSNSDLLYSRQLKDRFIAEYLKSKEKGRAFLYNLLRDRLGENISSAELEHRIKRFGLNPCVTSDTWIHTESGARQVKDLIGKQIKVYVNGKLYDTTENGFFCNGFKQVFSLLTKEGYFLHLTEDHLLLKNNVGQGQEWCKLKDLKQGDKVEIHNHQLIKPWLGNGTENEGYEDACNYINPNELNSFEYYRGYLKGFFEYHIKFILIHEDTEKYYCDAVFNDLKSVQQMQRILLRVGIVSAIVKKGIIFILTIKDDGLINLLVLIRYYQVLIRTYDKQDNLITTEIDIAAINNSKIKRQNFTVEILSIAPVSEQFVYDCTVPEISCFDANGFVAHNCAEVLGSDFRCNLGTVHLSQVGVSVAEQREAFIAAALQVLPLLKLDVDIPRFKFSHSIDPIVLVSATQVNQWFINYFGAGWVEWWLEGRPDSDQGRKYSKEEAIILSFWRKTIQETVQEYCVKHGLKTPNRYSGFKPEGSLSWLSGSPGFSGIHFPPSGSLIYIRRKTFLRDDPVALAAIDYGYQVIPGTDCKDENGQLLDDPYDPRVKTWLLEIPVKESILDKFPELQNINFNQISALAQFDWLLQLQQNYSTHNTSCTINFRENEIEDLSKAVHEAIVNNKGYVSMALLARYDESQTFPRMPFESINLGQYDRMMSQVLLRRKSDNFEDLIKQKLSYFPDLTTGEVACSSEICEIRG